MRRKRQRLPHSQVGIFGPCSSVLAETKRAELFARNLGAKSISYFTAPETANGPEGFKLEETCTNNQIYQSAGGVIKDKHQGFVIESHDCPVIILEHQGSGYIGVVRAGRDQLVNPNNPCCSIGIIEMIIPLLGPLDGSRLSAYIAGGLSAVQFEASYGLVKIVRQILQKYGVPSERVKDEGLSLFDSSWGNLNKRRGDDYNWTIVVKQ